LCKTISSTILFLHFDITVGIYVIAVVRKIDGDNDYAKGIIMIPKESIKFC